MNSALSSLVAGLRSLLTWWVTVAPWEQGLRVRAGRHVRELGPGVYLKVPVLDRAYVQCTRLRTVNLPPITLDTSGRGHALTVVGVFEYAIADLRKLFDSLKYPEATLAARAGAALHERMREVKEGDEMPSEVAVDGFEAMGICSARVVVVSRCEVRTYRLITGESHLYCYDAFKTDDHVETPDA